ncbi:MAG: M20/M25/M40 family metallo-hydrolase [Bacilli bacterium]|nr:M20/M25/M40 family metallo-hydrolase [Bacilli bacterium]
MNKKFLYKMLETPSVSGSEYELQKHVMEYMKIYADEIITDNVGNVICALNPHEEFKVMLAAHADEIGLTISRILDDGRCLLEEVGSITAGVYVGQRVQILTKKGIILGAIAKNRKVFDNKPEAKDLVLDIGVYSKDEAMKLVDIGDLVLHDATYCEINNNILCARALDNKIGIYALSEVFKRVRERDIKIGVYFASTVGEETTKNGATIAARTIKPNAAIVVDVGSDTSILPNSENSNFNHLNGGPILAMGTTMNKKLEGLVRQCAKDKEIKLQNETVVYRSYTDADAINQIDLGIPTTLISIPLRNMHSSAELVDLRDVEEVIELIVQVLLRLNEDFNFNPYQ